MRGRVRHRLEKLEQALRPKGRVFFMWDDSPHGHLHGAQSRPAAQMAQGCSSLGRRRTTPVTAETYVLPRSRLLSDGMADGAAHPGGPLSPTPREARAARDVARSD